MTTETTAGMLRGKMDVIKATDFVVLVDDADNEVGTCEKLEAHRRGLRHRAFSIIVKNVMSDILIQRRASTKYHSPGLWANTCCGHPQIGEDVPVAARRRLGEELGFDCGLEWKRSHLYRSRVGAGMIESEFVHIFFGTFNGEVMPNAEEVSDFRWVQPEKLMVEIAHNPENYAIWLQEYIANFGDEIVGYQPQR